MQRRRSDRDAALLLQQYRETRDPELRDRIVMQFSNLVESIARRFSHAAEPVEDLAQEGYIGLITAIDLYDPSKNVKFSTYATHFVIGQIKHCLRDRGKIIKEPAWLQELNQRITRVMDSLAQQLDRPATYLEIARMMGMSEEAVAELMTTREIFKVSSIDGGSDQEEESIGTVNMERQRAVDVGVSFQLPLEDRVVLETAMEKLKTLEQKVVAAFYYRHLNQTEIADQLGISCNYVSHILRNSTRKLRKILVSDELREMQRAATASLRRADGLGEDTALVDPLTHLYTKGYFEDRLSEQLAWASRNSTQLSILFVQLAGVPAFYRGHGTLKGDEAIVGVVRAIQSGVRKSDIITRYDDQTLALILPHTGRSVLVVRDRLELLVRTWLTEKGWDRGKSPLAVGFGLATYPGDGSMAVSLTTVALRIETSGEGQERAA